MSDQLPTKEELPSDKQNNPRGVQDEILDPNSRNGNPIMSKDTLAAAERSLPAAEIQASDRSVNATLEKLSDGKNEKTFANGLSVKRNNDKTYTIVLPGVLRNSYTFSADGKTIKDSMESGTAKIDGNGGLILGEYTIDCNGSVITTSNAPKLQIEYPAHGKWTKKTIESEYNRREEFGDFRLNSAELIRAKDGTSILVQNSKISIVKNSQMWRLSRASADLAYGNENERRELSATKDATAHTSLFSRNDKYFVYPADIVPGNVMVTRESDMGDKHMNTGLTVQPDKDTKVLLSDYRDDGNLKGLSIQIHTDFGKPIKHDLDKIMKAMPELKAHGMDFSPQEIDSQKKAKIDITIDQEETHESGLYSLYW